MKRHQRPVVADVVHQHVDPPVFGEHSIDQPIHVVVDGDIGDVAADGPTCAFDLVQDPICALLIELGDLDERPVLGKQPRDAGADAGAAAGDHGDASVEKPVPVVDAWDAIVSRHADGHYAPSSF